MLARKRKPLTCVHRAFVQWFRHSSEQSAGADSSLCSNPAEKAINRGITSTLVEFEISWDEAITRFDAYQASKAKGFHAHGLLTNPSAKISAAYLPYWTFSSKVTAEYRGVLGFKDARCGS